MNANAPNDHDNLQKKMHSAIEGTELLTEQTKKNQEKITQLRADVAALEGGAAPDPKK